MEIALRTYNVNQAEYEMNRWLAAKWTIQSVSTTDGHLNVGRTVIPALATGGLSLLLGGSRSSGTITVVYNGTGVHPDYDPFIEKVRLWIIVGLVCLAYAWLVTILFRDSPLKFVFLSLGSALAMVMVNKKSTPPPATSTVTPPLTAPRVPTAPNAVAADPPTGIIMSMAACNACKTLNLTALPTCRICGISDWNASA